MVTYHGSGLKVAVKPTTPAYTDATATTDITWDFARDKEIVYKHGDPAPQEIKTGHWAITGTLTRKYETGNFSAAGMTFLAMCQSITAGGFHVAVFPAGAATPKIDLEDCFFNGYSMKAPLKGIVEESAKFDGFLVTVT